MIAFSAVVWIVWLALVAAIILVFCVYETWAILGGGPTLSTVWRRWEDHGPRVKGVVKWTAFRFFTLFLLLAVWPLSVYLLLHWVAEVVQ